MKKELLFISAFLLSVLSGCVNETLQPESSKELKVSVSLASVQTKTYLGEVDGNVRQVYWSEGDAVSMNGFASDVLTADQAGKATADFKFYNGSVPYRVIYPASICKEFTPDGMVTVDVPATQEYSSDSFGKGSAILYGYSDVEGSPVVLHNLCGAVKVSLKSEAGAMIKRAVLISNDKTVPVAGTFVIDPQTGAYTVSEGVKSISLNIDQVIVDANGQQSFYFTVPYGSYPAGFTVKFYDSDLRPMECSWLRDKDATNAGVNIAAGKLYEFNPVDFIPGKKEILTGEDWKYIAEQINEGETDWKAAYLDGNTIRLGDDIVLPEGTPQITENFTYELDGRGFSITNHNATAALIKTLPAGGVIRNLTMAGEMKTPDATKPLVEVAAFVHIVSGGKMEDCVNEMAFNVESCRVIFGAFARTFSCGELNRCVNNADMTIRMDLTSHAGLDMKKDDFKSFGGGLVATCFEPSSGCPQFNGCVNNGDLNISVRTATFGLARNGFAGILGYVSIKNKDCYPILTDCTNNGDVTLSFEDSPGRKIQYSVGGIVGLSAALMMETSTSPANDVKYGAISMTADHYYIKLENCTNTGRINNNAVSSVTSAEINTKVYTGGIAGTLLGSSTNHAKIINCKNTGEVVPYSVKVNNYTRASICGVCGGFLGLGGYVDIEGGVMNAKVGTAESRSFATAGVIGLAVGKFSVKNMSVNANISMIQSSDYTENNHALAVTNSTKVIKSNLAGSEISNCAFSGSFLTICSGKYNSDPVIPTEITHVTADDFPAGTNVVSKSYTNGGITMSDNTYWSNVNAQ